MIPSPFPWRLACVSPFDPLWKALLAEKRSLAARRYQDLVHECLCWLPPAIVGMLLDLALAGEMVGFHARQFPDPTAMPSSCYPALSSPLDRQQEEELEEDLAAQVETQALRR